MEVLLKRGEIFMKDDSREKKEISFIDKAKRDHNLMSKSNEVIFATRVTDRKTKCSVALGYLNLHLVS